MIKVGAIRKLQKEELQFEETEKIIGREPKTAVEYQIEAKYVVTSVPQKCGVMNSMENHEESFRFIC